MAKGINIVESTYENAPDGPHFVKGFEFITTDDSDAPHFVPDDFKGMVTRIRFLNVEEDKAAPAMSLKPAEFVALVHLFGVTDFNPTKQNRTLAPVLLEGMRKANEKHASLKVVSTNGWANYVNGLHVPEGRYDVRFTGAYPRDYAWLDGTKGGEYINLFFDIAGETVWEGFTIKVSLNNIFLETRKDEDGFEHTAVDDECPILAGGINQRRWANFGTYFCNDLWANHNWKTDPVESQYGLNEVVEPQKVILPEAVKANAVVAVWYEKKKNSAVYHFEMADLTKFNTVSKERVATNEDFVAFVKARNWTYLNEDKDEITIDTTIIFSNESPVEFVLDENGRSEWGRQFLSGPWQIAELNPDDRQFANLSPSDMGRLLDAMESVYGE